MILNALDYVKKNLLSFSELLAGSVNSKNIKKDLSGSSMGASGSNTSRNGYNKENLGTNSITSYKSGGSKSEKKMFIK
jgi:hypothetical protein